MRGSFFLSVNHHPIEYQMYFANLRANASERIDAWYAATAAVE